MEKCSFRGFSTEPHLINEPIFADDSGIFKDALSSFMDYNVYSFISKKVP